MKRSDDLERLGRAIIELSDTDSRMSQRIRIAAVVRAFALLLKSNAELVETAKQAYRRGRDDEAGSRRETEELNAP